jgi:calcineurin-like phosphoesterase family protein
VGDTRPPTEDDTAGYPTAIITKIYQDIQAASPRPAFVITTGDYMFAGPTHTPGTQATQMGYYMTARAAYSGVQFPAMGNHECDGATQDNCYACGSACSNVGGTCVGTLCETPNYSVFLSQMLAPINQNLPYYTINVNGPSNAWTAKFVFVACNMWSPTQATWLASQLSTTTTYTFVVRHEGTIATTAPCLSGTGSMNADTILSGYLYTLLIAGHTHTYEYFSDEKQIVVGNGGAPLAGTVDYGYVIARQQANGSIVFTAYDYATNALLGNLGSTPNPFTVQ